MKNDFVMPFFLTQSISHYQISICVSLKDGSYIKLLEIRNKRLDVRGLARLD